MVCAAFPVPDWAKNAINSTLIPAQKAQMKMGVGLQILRLCNLQL